MIHSFRDALKTAKGLSFPAGETDTNEILYADLAEISHLLVAGASGTGKSVFIDNLLLSLISNNGPESLRLVLCDTKMVEFSVFNGVSNLLSPVCSDARKIHIILQWVALETEKRLRVFSSAGKKNISSYNDYTWEGFISDIGLPQIVVVVDDFVSALLEQPEMADSIRTILLNGRTTGVHLILSTQTPTWKSAKSISTLFRAKVLFSVSDKAESKAMINNCDAFALGNVGDAIYSNGTSSRRIHTYYPDESVSAEIISKSKAQFTEYFDIASDFLRQTPDAEIGCTQINHEPYDELLPDAIEVVLEQGQASVSMLQRRLKLAYSRAARIVDQMEEKGVIGPFEGSKARQILITKEQWHEMQNEAVPENVEDLEITKDEDNWQVANTERDNYEYSGLIGWVKQEIQLQREYRESVKQEQREQKELRKRIRKGIR